MSKNNLMRNSNIILIMVLLFLASCSSSDQKESTKVDNKFDKQKWAELYDSEFIYRQDMLDDLISNYLQHGMKQDSVMRLLGEPDRIDNGHLFYKISQKKLGFFPLATKTLVIKFKQDSTLEWRKVHG